MRQLTIILSALVSAACTADAGDEAHKPSEAAPLIQFRLVEERPSAGYESVECNGDTLYVGQAVVSDPDLRSVRPYARDRGLLLDIRFTDEGADRLRSATAAHIGKRLAFSVRSLVCSAAVIRSAGGGGSLTVSLEATEDEAVRIVQAVRTKWPVPSEQSQ